MGLQAERPAQVLVIGNSHTVALRWAYDVLAANGGVDALRCEFVFILTEPYDPPLVDKQLNPSIHERIVEPEVDFIVSMLGGNDHNMLGLVNHPTKFDFVLPDQPHLPLQADAEVVPYELLKRTLLRRLKLPFRLLRLVNATTRKPLYHLESPPPIPSENHIKRHPVGFGDLIDERGVAPAALRYKLWRLHSELYREACERHRIRFVPAPKALQDRDGMLIEKAWNPDPTHGNIHYGFRLYDQLLAIAARRFSDPRNAAEAPEHASITGTANVLPPSSIGGPPTPASPVLAEDA